MLHLPETQLRPEGLVGDQPFVADIAKLREVFEAAAASIHHMSIPHVLPSDPVPRGIHEMRILAFLFDHELERALDVLRSDSPKAEHVGLPHHDIDLDRLRVLGSLAVGLRQLSRHVRREDRDRQQREDDEWKQTEFEDSDHWATFCE